MRETLILCVCGIAVGYGLSYLGQQAVAVKFPLVPVILLRSWMGWSAVLAVIGSLVGAFYPAWKAASADPIEALDY